MRSLNLDQLRALEAVAESGSFTVAAKRLNLSQSAISVQIRELEERLGVQLIERLGKTAFPTEAGREVIQRASRIAEETQAIADDMRRHREGWLGRVRLGAGPNHLSYVLPPALRALGKAHPTLELKIRTGIAFDIVGMVIRNELDLAVVTTPIDQTGLSVTPWRNEALVAILPGTETRAPKYVTQDYMARWPLIFDGRSQTDRAARAWLRAGGFEPKVAMEVDQPEAIRNLVAIGLGASIWGPEIAQMGGFAGGRVVTRPLRPAVVRKTVLIQRKDKPDTAALKAVRAALMTLATR